MKPPMPYAGGKQRLADKIIALMPEHLHYVEPFAGALSVLLAKPVSKLETINDLDGEITTFWRVLRDQPDQLERVCALTPHSRQDYMAARLDHSETDDLTKAWRVWVRLTQGRGARTNGNDGWRFVKGGTTRHSLAEYLTGYLARIVPAAQRLHHVSIESRPAVDVIRTYDRASTLLYLDPPYMLSTRHSAMYHVEMGTEDAHAELLDTLATCQAKIILSGYRCDLYDQALTDWTRIDLPTTCMTGAKRTESLWINYDPPTPTLDIEP